MAQLDFAENLYKVKFTVMLGDQVIRTFEADGANSLDDLAGADVRTDIASLKREQAIVETTFDLSKKISDLRQPTVVASFLREFVKDESRGMQSPTSLYTLDTVRSVRQQESALAAAEAEGPLLNQLNRGI